MIYTSENFLPLKIFEKNFELIREEMLQVLHKPMVEAHLATWLQEHPDLVESEAEGWKTYTFRFFGIDHLPNKESCPTIAAIIDDFPTIVTAEFSLLSAGTHILPHTGFTDDVLRAHLPLVVPKGNVHLKIETEICDWKEGELLIFNDRKEHEVWNKTDEDRVILMLDFEPTFDEVKAKGACRKILMRTNDRFMMNIAPREKWLEWFENGCFPKNI